MYCFADFLVLWCLFDAGYFFGYFWKCVFYYIFPRHHVLLCGITAIALASIWTLQKYRRKQYCFNHYYIIFCGLICSLISACLMLFNKSDMSFYFGFIGLSPIFIASFSFISLRSTSRGLRPMRIALGNMMFFVGITTGYIIFDIYEPSVNGWTYLVINLALLGGIVINEILQYRNIQCYKKSCDLVFNLMNDEKFIFLPTKSIYALYKDRPEFSFTKNRQWLVVLLSIIVVLEQIFMFSPPYLQMTWSSTPLYQNTEYFCDPFLFLTIGCALGTGLMAKYQPKLIYMMFGLIKITLMAAILGIFYQERKDENCFYFLCFYYISMGVYSSVVLQLVLECTPFLYTELGLALVLSIKMYVLEHLEYETFAVSPDPFYSVTISSMVLTAICLIIVPLFLPPSGGLIEIRNRLLGIQRHCSVVPETKIWNANYFLHHDKQPSEFSNVCFDGMRIFQQYPRVDDKI